MTPSDQRPRISRDDHERIAPAVVAALRALGKAVDESGLEKPLTELIKVRASQINGCGFCPAVRRGAKRAAHRTAPPGSKIP